jgi:hypothetical protein
LDRPENKEIWLRRSAEGAPFADGKRDAVILRVLIEHVMDAVRHQLDEE